MLYTINAKVVNNADTETMTKINSKECSKNMFPIYWSPNL